MTESNNNLIEKNNIINTEKEKEINNAIFTPDIIGGADHIVVFVNLFRSSTASFR